MSSQDIVLQWIQVEEASFPLSDCQVSVPPSYCEEKVVTVLNFGLSNLETDKYCRCLGNNMIHV